MHNLLHNFTCPHTYLLELLSVLVPVLVQLVLLLVVVVLVAAAHAAIGDGHVLPDVALADPVAPLVVVVGATVAAALILFLRGVWSISKTVVRVRNS